MRLCVEHKFDPQVEMGSAITRRSMASDGVARQTVATLSGRHLLQEDEIAPVAKPYL